MILGKRLNGNWAGYDLFGGGASDPIAKEDIANVKYKKEVSYRPRSP